MSSPFPATKILVPLDFSDDSRRALDYALAVARSTGAALVLVTVVEDTFPYPELFAWDHPNEEFYRAMRERALHHMEELLAGQQGANQPGANQQNANPGSDVAIERVVVRGRPRQEIAALAKDVGADLIVLARHGSSGLRSALMGSTAEGVLHHAPCPVLMLPPPAATGA